jgi:hypothetical protein
MLAAKVATAAVESSDAAKAARAKFLNMSSPRVL